MIRVFPRRNKWTPTDELAFVGNPPLFRPPEQPVKISVTFTWDISEGERLYRAWSDYYQDVELGGVAFGSPCDSFTAGQFIKNGVTFTSRGCPKKCKECFVPEREGKLKEMPITDGYIIQDNNLLACSKEHIKQVFLMLGIQKKYAIFAGGLDFDFLSEWHIDLFHSINIKELWFACDRDKDIPRLLEKKHLLQDFSKDKLRCYVMIGNDETLSQAESRLKKVFQNGFMPFAQLYQPKKQIKYNKSWHDLQRKWSRPAIYKSQMFNFNNG